MLSHSLPCITLRIHLNPAPLLFFNRRDKSVSPDFKRGFVLSFYIEEIAHVLFDCLFESKRKGAHSANNSGNTLRSETAGPVKKEYYEADFKSFLDRASDILTGYMV